MCTMPIQVVHGEYNVAEYRTSDAPQLCLGHYQPYMSPVGTFLRSRMEIHPRAATAGQHIGWTVSDLDMRLDSFCRSDLGTPWSGSSTRPQSDIALDSASA